MRNTEIMKVLSLLSQVGFMMAIPIIGCIWFGHYLDERLHTKVLFLIIFTILGTLAAFRNLFVIATRSQGNNKNGKDSKK